MFLLPPPPRSDRTLHMYAHQVTIFTHDVLLFNGLDISVVGRFFGRMDVRPYSTDIMCENNDHLFGRGLVGQLKI